jgi:hypothetical protein
VVLSDTIRYGYGIKTMTAAVIEKEPFEVPEGGLASFLTATEGDWSDSAIEGAETDYVLELADKLAGYGREGDTALAHVAPGETVIPMEVFEADPELKSRLFAQMQDMGLEPERYIVGSELNSINPTTGQPEFFLKKIFKGVKKAVKGVVKVFKKFAPIILSVGLNFLVPGLGAIAAGALGSGIGTLVQGGSIKDAFKAALIGGAVGGISSGITSVAQGGTFMSGVKGGLPGGTFGGGPAPTPAPIVDGVPDFVAGAADSAAVLPPSAADAVAQAAPAAPITATQATQAATQTGLAPGTQAAEFFTAPSGMETVAVTAKAPTAGIQFSPPAQGAMTGAASGAAVGPEVVDGVPSLDLEAKGLYKRPALSDMIKERPGFFESISKGDFKEAFMPTTYSAEDVLEAWSMSTGNPIPDPLSASGASVWQNAAKLAATNSPGMIRQYAPMLGIAGIGMKLGGLFDAPEMEELTDGFGGMTGSKRLQMYPQQYGLVQPGSGFTPIGAADGGAIQNFPRRTGPIYGPGTETSDDVPAMLSDGEFVMTARAVRGAGNGSREQGMRRMYDMMRKFEGGAVSGR